MPTDEQTKQDLARGFHKALITKDWSLLREIMSPDVRWTLPGDNVISGTASGVDEVIARAQLIAGYGLTFTLDHILMSRENMALGLHNTARRGEAALDEHLATVCTLREGRIVAVETYLSDVDGMNAFFVPLD
jgi:ketosteroid isomerase-like protein